MFRIALSSLALLALPTGALATPFVLDVQFDGAPLHSSSVFGPSRFTTERWRVDVDGPPLGTSSMDLRLSLPATYRPAAGLTFDFGCSWGGRSSSSGSQRIDLLTAPGTVLENDGLPEPSDARLQISGPTFNPDAVNMTASGTTTTDTFISSMRMLADETAMTPTTYHAGSGGCEVSVHRFSDVSTEDFLLVERAPVPLEEAAEALSADAQSAYDARFASRPAPSAAQVDARLASARDALVAGGCLVDDDVQGIAGAYGPDGATGMDGNGPLLDALLSRGARTFSGTLSNGTTFGDADFSSFNNQGQVIAERSDGGFVVGRFVRVKGTRGVWHALTGTCEGPSNASEALADWYKGSVSPF